jgi:YHS domain-containing protein
MRRLTTLAAVVAVCVGLASALAAADDAAKPAAAAVTNKGCPVTGEEVSAKYRIEYQGQYVYFCCGGCADRFTSDPDAAIAKLSAEDKAAIQKNTTCPVSGEAIEHFDIRSEVDGRLVYFCCPMCKSEFDKKHGTR